MSERNEKKKGIQRYSISLHRTSSVVAISLESLIRKHHIVRIDNVSVAGVGIESSEPMRPALIYFEDPVGGQKFGLITWCRPSGNGYKAGIHFISMTQEQEQYVLNKLRQCPSHTSVPDPENIFRSLLQSFRNEIKQ